MRFQFFTMTPCPACTAQRVHTEQEWTNHPTRGHGYTREQGWTHPQADVDHKAAVEKSKADAAQKQSEAKTK